MVITDKVYGKFHITSPVILALIASIPMQRLKGIGQYGIPDRYYHLKNYPRFEHCIGVMLLLNKLGASEEEQIAGLLHDASHTAFSHVIDWVLGSGATEDYQDQQHKRFIASTEIPKILSAFGYDPKRITDYHHFSLLERDLPDLCADRVDYSLREFPKKIAIQCFLGLTSHKGKIVCKNKKSAFVFATNFLKRQQQHWGGFEAVSRYRIFADVLKTALRKKIIEENDFWQNDAFVTQKLLASKDKDILRILHVLQKKTLSQLPKSIQVVHKKFRYVDPLFLHYGNLVRLSTVDQQFAHRLEEARIENEKGITIAMI